MQCSAEVEGHFVFQIAPNEVPMHTFVCSLSFVFAISPPLGIFDRIAEVLPLLLSLITQDGHLQNVRKELEATAVLQLTKMARASVLLGSITA